ncbi:hypothetical protein FRC19_011852 [Serendipita sp. 401]|nr:hypothetical protein FRC19_011852 [Serendipita sp. 401]
MNNSQATLRSNPTPTFGSQNRDLGTATTAPHSNRHYQPSNAPPLLGKLPSNPLKRNPLIRRRTPPDIDRYLFEKEVDVFSTPMEGTSSALGTLLVEETFKTAPKGPSVVSEAVAINALPGKTLKLGIKESFSGHDSALPKDQDEAPPRSAIPEKIGLERSLSHRGIIKETETMTVHNESLPERATTVNMSGKTLVPIAPTLDPVILTEEPIQEPVSDSSTRSPTAEPNHLVRPERNIDDSSDSEGENISEYEPQDFATQQDTLEHEVTPSEQSEEEGETLFHEQKRKRGAEVQGGRGLKRICRRKNSPKVDALMEDHTETPERSPPAIRRPILSPLDTRNIDTVGSMSTRRSTRATRESRTRTGSNARKSAALGHFVIVRRSETKRYFAGYAVERSGKHWQVDPCDGGVPIFAEPKHLRKCVFQEGDLVYVSPDGVGENIGDAIVIAVDERWDEERLVQVNIGDEPKRYVAARYLSVLERNIKQWDSRKITHKDLETEDGVETMLPPTSALGRSNSMITPAKTNTNGSSIRIPQVGSNKHFFGAGFILSNCDDTMARRIKDRGGFIYNSWLFAYRFNGGIEKIKSNKPESRWIRRAEQARGRNKGPDLPAVQWIGDEIESTVKTIFVVAGKVATTAKNLIALALGVPIISFQWIEACETAGERVDWIPYLLPSHNQPNPLALDPELPGILPLQMPDPMWGSQAYGVTVLRDILTHSPLLHRRILLNKPMALYLSDGCIQKLKDDSKEGKKAPSCSSPFAYLLLALGAQHVEAVEQHFHATDPTLLKYDIIVVSDAWFSDIIPKKSKANKGMNNALSTAIDKGALVISQSDLKLTIACGRVVKAPVSEKSSPTIDT